VTDEPEADEPAAHEPDRRPASARKAIPPTAGLCSGCIHARLIVSGRGSRFVLCERSRTDRRFPRYPPLPMMRCVGFETVAAG
jgi:hypothetical protein